MKNPKISLSFLLAGLLLAACGPDIPYVVTGTAGEEPTVIVDLPITAPSPAKEVESTPNLENTDITNIEQARLLVAENDLAAGLRSSNGDINGALVFLVENNKADAIKLAKKQGADLNAIIHWKRRALDLAILWDKQEAMFALLEAGVETNYANGFGDTPLMTAANKNSHLIVPLVDSGAKVNFAPSGKSPLHRAVKSKNIASLKVLIRLGADVNFQESHTGKSAAHMTVPGYFPEGLQLLLENGANPKIEDKNGKNVFELVKTFFSDSSETYEEWLKILAPYR